LQSEQTNQGQTALLTVAYGDVITHKSRTDKCRIFKLGGSVDHMSHHLWTTSKVKGQGHKVM